MSTNKIPSVANLKRAIEIAEQIERLQAQLASLVGGNVSTASAPAVASPVRKKGKRGGKRNMSPEARERIAAAQRARWAKSKGASAPVSKSPAGVSPVVAKPAAPKPAKKVVKRNISPEARAKMAAAAKRRWAKVKK